MHLIDGITEEKRTDIVNHLFDILKAKYKKELLFFGLKWSMARWDYTEMSDIDAIAIIKNWKSESKGWYYKDTSIDIDIYNTTDAKKKITEVSAYWPYTVGGLLESKIIFEKWDIISELKEEVEKLRKDPKIFLNQCLTWWYNEYYSKAIRDFNNKEYEMLRYDAWELFIMICMDLGLINQQYYTVHWPHMLKQFNRMKQFLPINFKKNVELCFHNDQKKVFEGCTYILEQSKEWQVRFSYGKLPHNKKYDTVEQIKL